MRKKAQKVEDEEWVYGIGLMAFIIVALMVLFSCTHTYTNDGREYELHRRCISGRYNGIADECGTRRIECDSSVIDTFWISRKAQTMYR